MFDFGWVLLFRVQVELIASFPQVFSCSEFGFRWMALIQDASYYAPEVRDVGVIGFLVVMQPFPFSVRVLVSAFWVPSLLLAVPFLQDYNKRNASKAAT